MRFITESGCIKHLQASCTFFKYVPATNNPDVQVFQMYGNTP